MEVPSIRYRQFNTSVPQEASEKIKKRVEQARTVQKQRFGNTIQCNARMSNKQIKSYCNLDDESQNLIEMAMDKFGFSGRAVTKILKVSRTIADLEGCESVRSHHISEAIQYRSLDRKLSVY
jgi:magnesium chelatase family protein